jgi:hypothetical protein
MSRSVLVGAFYAILVSRARKSPSPCRSTTSLCQSAFRACFASVSGSTCSHPSVEASYRLDHADAVAQHQDGVKGAATKRQDIRAAGVDDVPSSHDGHGVPRDVDGRDRVTIGSIGGVPAASLLAR